MYKFIKMLAITVACFLSLQAFAQSGNAREMLEKRVAETNKVLPVSVQQGITFKNMYVEDFFVYEIQEIDERYISFTSLKHKKGLMKKTILKKYGEDPNLMTFAQMVVECNMDIVIRCVCKQSGESFEMVLKTSELEKTLQ